ncbi:MAG: hypothetical protein KF760_28750 [Candidatus Eremiobacteraeota bacterium]|nr:hypothetical protein [Candidatus Eremiobacteraeota bacterium]MCW5865886.1 hypothetical protein [Candidatus Eremiobacteraeota bacterium]
MKFQDVTSVDEFIAGFYAGASLDSQGVFTVDLERRMAKLRKFQLRSPEHFVLALMRVASLGEATTFELERELTWLRFNFDGQLFTRQELESISLMLAKSAVDAGARRLQSLGYALLLAANLQHGCLRFCSGDFALLRRGQSWRVEPAAAQNHSSLDMERAAWEFFLPGRLSKTYQAVQGLLRKRCIYGPPLLRPAQRYSFQPAPFGLLIQNGPPIPWVEPSQCLGRVHFPEQPDCHGVILLGGEERELVLVSAGVGERVAGPQSNYPYQAVLWCDSLKSDLGGEKLVQDETFLRLLKYLVLWLLRLELEVVATQGVAGALGQPASRATLWGLRQQLVLALPPLEVEWIRRPAQALPIDLGLAASAYSGRQWLAVAGEAEGELRLGDGTPVFSRGPDTAPLLDLVFPLQREFFNCYGRAVPRQLMPGKVPKDGLFRQFSSMLFDAQVGLNWTGDSETWVYERGLLQSVEDPDPRLPEGCTLIRWGKRPLQNAEFQRLLDTLQS